MRPFVASVTVAAALSAASCTAPYAYNGISYHTPKEALAAMDRSNTEIADQIPRESAPKYGRIVVVIPTRGALSARQGARSVGTSGEGDQFLVEGNFQAYFSAQAMIQKRNLFSGVDLRESDDPDREAVTLAAQGSTSLYVSYPDPSSSVWMLLAPGLPIAIPVVRDGAVPFGVPRTMRWLGELESAMELAATYQKQHPR